ncbi:hypothetical protein HDV04_003665 [Boothiomyces sp. JEL0838]|nr:hypothetical protein HDV04_003665 [Boothiomyces sp. JEL0838]
MERHVITRNISQEYPSTANGYEYCMLKDYNSEDIIQASFLDNGGCINGFFQCSGDFLYIFDQDQCAGTPIISSVRNNTMYGNYTISKEVVQGSTNIKWITSVPYQPQLQHVYGYPPLEVFAIITSILAMIGFLFSIAYYSKRYYRAPSFDHFFLLATQLVWQTRCVLTLIDIYYVPFSTLDSAAVLGLWCLSDLCTLMSTLISVKILLRVLNLEGNFLKSALLYGLVLGVAIVFASPTFFYFIYFLGYNVQFIDSLYSFYVDQLYFGWELFMFLFDIIPPAVILFKMTYLNITKPEQQNQIGKWKSRIYAMFAIEGINIITYVALFTLQYQTAFLGGDNQFESVWLIQLLNFFIHNMIILSLFESLKEMMKVAVFRIAINPQQSEHIMDAYANKETLIGNSNINPSN